MIEFKKATKADIAIIQSIARNTWPKAFGTVMPKEQIEYMLNIIYNTDALKAQMGKKNHNFLLACEKEKMLGFASYELNFNNNSQLMIHKIYLLPSSQGLGIGNKIMKLLSDIGIENNNNELRLKVFYKNI